MLRALFVIFTLILLSRSLVAEPIRIGWSGPLSGNSAVLGIDSVQAVRLAIDEANLSGGVKGRRIELIVEDDAYDTAKALSSYSKLVSGDGVAAILMSTYGGVFATAQRALNDGVIVINPLDCNNDIAALPRNTFCIATESESIGRILAEDMHRRGVSPVGVIYDESNPFMVLVEKSLRGRLSELGESNYYATAVNQNNLDYKPMLLRFRKLEVASLVFFGHDSMGTAMAQARKLGMDSQFYTLGTITSPGYQKLAGSAANGALVAYWEAPRNAQYEDFLKRFELKTARAPVLELATVPSYDAAMILINALRQASDEEGEVSSQTLSAKLYTLKDYAGLSGTLSMDSDGAVRSIREKLFRFESGMLYGGGSGAKD